jgi:hypothetical protein
MGITHTHTHTHTHKKHAYVSCMWKVNCNNWNPGVTLLWGIFQCLKEHQTKKNTWSGINSTNVLGKKTYNHLYANEQVNLNSPECLPKPITGIEIISSKLMMHIDTYIKLPGHTLGMFNECWIFSHQTICHKWSSETQHWTKRQISDFQEASLTCITWNSVSSRHRYGKYFTITQGPPHTHTYTHTHNG